MPPSSQFGLRLPIFLILSHYSPKEVAHHHKEATNEIYSVQIYFCDLFSLIRCCIDDECKPVLPSPVCPLMQSVNSVMLYTDYPITAFTDNQEKVFE